MILLRPDYLVFKTVGGENILCSAHEVTLELIGQAAEWLDDELVEHATEAVVHYFKSEKGLNAVSVAEFSGALRRVLRNLGLRLKPVHPTPNTEALAPAAPGRRVIDADLQDLADESVQDCELLLFPRLRNAIHRQLDGTPLILRFKGLRPCVKRLTKAKRWSPHCQSLNDQIVEYLRACLTAEKDSAGCALVVW